jgi:UDP-glucose 4-epimerase
MEMTQNRQKLVLVTGGAGFIGSHLCERLFREGYRVISLDNYFTGSIENHIEGVEYRTGHTKDIAEHVQETPDIVYHLGEYSRTEKSFEDVELVWGMNTLGTFAVLEFCRRNNCKLIYAGSSTKFADGGSGKDQSPYAWSKATNTELVKNYGVWFGLTYAITYFYNVYGPREMSGPYGTLIRIFSELYKNGQPLMVVSPGTQIRNFTHVDDIVAGLVLVGEKGVGDGYGIGADEAYTVRDVAEMFGGEIVMMPERKGNRMQAPVESQKSKELGWRQTKKLSAYITAVKESAGKVSAHEERVLVFSTTFYPNAGKAEEALGDIMRAMPQVHFDVITSKFSKENLEGAYCAPNVTLHRVGFGNILDKYLLPFWGASVARALKKRHDYTFSWALFASYGALAALFSQNKKKLPLLITIADQRVAQIPLHIRILLGHILGRADQIHADDTYEHQTTISLADRVRRVKSLGTGSAFINQIRFTYSTMLRNRTQSYEK